MSDLQKMLRESLAARAGQLDEPTQYAASPALVSDVAARVAQLHRRRTVARVGGAAAGVLVIAVVGGVFGRGPSTAGPLLPAGPGSSTAVQASSTVTRAVTGTDFSDAVAATRAGDQDAVAAARAAAQAEAEAAARTAAAQAAETARHAAVLSEALTGRRPPVHVAEDRIIRAALAVDPRYSRGFYAPEGSRLACGFHRFGSSLDGTYRYVWANCSMFVGETVVSGESLPLRLQVRGSGASLELLGVDAPGDGTAYEPGVRRLFPPELVDAILDAHSDLVPVLAEGLALRDARDQMATAGPTAPAPGPARQ